MKTITKSVLIAGVAGLALTTMFARASNRQGTEVIHYSVKVTMTNTLADTNTPNASGSAQATEAIQGNADKETLSVTAKGLNADTDYSVSANTSGGTTNLGPVTTDKRGNLKATFSTNGKSKNNLGAPPTPLTSVTEVDVVNSNSASVLVTDTARPKTFQYMVKKSVVDTNGVTDTISISASTRSAKFGLSASGLTAGADYVLVFNGSPVQTNTANSKGDLKINSPLVSTNGAITNPLQLQSVELDATNGSPVFSTPIP